MDATKRWIRDPKVRHHVIGLGIGFLTTASILLFTLLPGLRDLYRQMEFQVLDLRFRAHPGARDAGMIAHLDIDDKSMRAIGQFPWTRDNYAGAIDALTELDARLIVFDVEFKQQSNPFHRRDKLSGVVEATATDGDQLLAESIAASKRTLIPFSLVVPEPVDRLLEPYWDRIRAAVLEDIAADADAVVRRSGAPAEYVQNHMEKIRDRVVLDRIRDRLEEDPALTEEEALKEMFHGAPAERHPPEAALIRANYQQARSIRRIEDRLTLRVEGPLTGKEFSSTSLYPPLDPFAEGTIGSGFVNVEADPDGVTRRVPMYWIYRGRALPHLQLQVICLLAGVPLNEVRIVPGQFVEVVPRPGNPGGLTEPIRIPVDERGQAIIQWAKGPGGTWPFVHVPFAAVLEFLERMRLADKAFDGAEQIMPDGAVLPGLRAEVLKRRKVGAAPAEIAALRDRIARREGEIFDAFSAAVDAKVAELEEKLKTPGLPPRFVEGIRTGIENCRNQRDGLAALRADRDDLRKKLAALLGGKVVLVGSASTASGDLKATPLWENFPGVGIHSNLLNDILTGTFVRAPWNGWQILALVFGGVFASLIAMRYGPIPSVLANLGFAATFAAGCVLLFNASNLWLDVTGPVYAVFFSYLGVAVFRQFTEERQKRQIRGMFEHYLAPEVIEVITANPEELKLGGDNRIATVFFSDVANFTTVSEVLRPDQVVKLLNEYLGPVSRVIQEQGGYVDKYIGDAVMAIFGAPVAYEDHAARACFAALDAQIEVGAFRERLRQQGLPVIDIRVGLNTGEMTVGNIGAEHRLNYTVIGDSVNLASRLEGQNKEYGTKIMISADTYELAKDRIIAREIDIIAVKGKKKGVRVYELVGRRDRPSPYPEEMLARFAEGLALYREMKWDAAIRCFEGVLELAPLDRPAAVFLERCEEFKAAPPPSPWDGVYHATRK